MVNVFLLLGSNIGDRRWFLAQAIAAIEKSLGAVFQMSSVYETQAWGKTDEADYLNQVLLLKIIIDPRILLNKILVIEKELGRERNEKWGARTIDIDILFYGNEIINEPDLIIPHPQLHKRKFTLEPLAEIAPDFVHPVLKQTIFNLNRLQDKLIIKKL